MATIIDDLRRYMNISQEYMLNSHTWQHYLLLYRSTPLPLGTTEAIILTIM